MILGEWRSGGVVQQRSLEALAAIVRTDHVEGEPLGWVAWDEEGDPWVAPSTRVNPSERTWLVQSFGTAAEERRSGQGLFLPSLRVYALSSNLRLAYCEYYELKKP
jgi:hypothetical protein